MTELSLIMIVVSIASVIICSVGYTRTRRLARSIAQAAVGLDQTAEDARLADFARHTVLSVVTVTGAEFSMTLADIERSEHGALRTWNVPTYVALRPDQKTPEGISG